MSIDPLAEKRYWASPYNFVQGNPLNRMDADGKLDVPIYDTNGNFFGNTKEGFIGKAIIYNGVIKSFSKNDILNFGGKYFDDTYISTVSQSKILTHIVNYPKSNELMGLGTEVKIKNYLKNQYKETE